ncbi:hypothetical protein DSM112329_02055 [Paraconexibacter sp. AEG42_29]|uniref:HTH tetR-type domain-containing protein n=1 Tax=Paraconexibacter sp. AEG42_29 TaxID=2997339 RepID=A0AAU7AU97_9ACTN
MPARPTAAPRRTQAERSAGAQERILDAVADCLVDEGYAALSFGRVAQLAQMSRGAVLHHFPDREQLLTATITRLWDQQRAAVLDVLSRHGEGDPIPFLLDAVWEAHKSRVWHAASEVWIAARTDPALLRTLAPLELALAHDIMAIGPQRLDPLPDGEQFVLWVSSALAEMRGLAMLVGRQSDPAAVEAIWRYSRDQRIAALGSARAARPKTASRG